MKSKALLCTVLAASLLASPFAMAQGDSPLPRKFQEQSGNFDNRDNNVYRREDRREERRDDRREDRRDARRDDRRDYRRDERQEYNRGYGDYRGQGYAYGHDRHGDRGAGPNHSFYRGDRLPPQYRTRQYVVEDWRGHRLSAPPHGYQWVQNGGDYILVAIATGVILNLLFSN